MRPNEILPACQSGPNCAQLRIDPACLIPLEPIGPKAGARGFNAAILLLPSLHSQSFGNPELPTVFLLVFAATLIGYLFWRLRSLALSNRKLADELDRLLENEALLLEAQRIGHMGSLKHNIASGSYQASPEFLRIYGMNPAQKYLTEEALRQRIHPDDYPALQDENRRAQSERRGFEFEYRIVLPDGAIRRVYTVVQPVLDHAGNLVEHLETVLDVTEQRRDDCALCHAQADLEHMDRTITMGELTASLAHEIIQPIAAAMTNANTCVRWLDREQPDLAEAREAAQRMVKDTTRAAEIIGRIRRLFKKNEPHRETVEINEIIREMTILLRSEAMECSVSIKTYLQPNLPTVLADRVQLQQVLMNLMVNGMDSMREIDGERLLLISSERNAEGQLQVAVRDTGIGLQPQQEHQIFTPFYTTKTHGTGLGLRISRSIIEAHSGRLWAISNQPRGTVFLFTLPIQSEASTT